MSTIGILYYLYKVVLVFPAAKVEVRKVAVIRDGVLPGCQAPTVTAVEENGRAFQSSKAGWCATKEEAISAAIDEVRESIEDNEVRRRDLDEELAGLVKALHNLNDTI